MRQSMDELPRVSLKPESRSLRSPMTFRLPAGWAVKKASPSRPRARPRSGSPGAALRAVPAGHAGDGRRPDPRVRALARGPASAGPDAGLDPDADRTQPARPEDIAAV